MANAERTSSFHILKGTAGTLEITVYVDGTPTLPAASPAPAVTAVDETGAAVTLGAATLGAAGTGTVTATIAPPASDSVGQITATWALTVDGVAQTFITYHEIVGDVLFTEAELRAHDRGAVAEAQFTDAKILAMRDLVKDSFETKCGVAFGLSFEREILSGPGISALLLRRPMVQSIRAAATRSGSTWTALTGTELAALFIDPSGWVNWESYTWPWGAQNIRVDYEHGYQPIPPEIKWAAMTLARDLLVGSNIPARATTQIDQSGTFTLATPGLRGSIYGIPTVDRVINDYAARHYIPGIG